MMRRQGRKDGGDDEERRQETERGDIRQAVSVSAGILWFLLTGSVSRRHFHTEVQGRDGAVTGRGGECV